jgi:hypothetical protein
VQQANPLGLHRGGQDACSGGVSARSVVARHEPGFDGIAANDEHDGNCCSRGLRRQRCGLASGRNEARQRQPGEFRRHWGHLVVLTHRPAVFDRNVLPLDIAGFSQASTQCFDQVVVIRADAEISDDGHA